jgi:hypothetical protein
VRCWQETGNTGGCQGLGEKIMGWADEKVLEMDGSDVCTIISLNAWH